MVKVLEMMGFGVFDKTRIAYDHMNNALSKLRALTARTSY